MKNASIMCCRESECSLQSDVNGFADRHFALHQTFPKSLPLKKLSREIGSLVSIGTKAIDDNNIWMIESGGCSRLLVKAAETLRIGGKVFRKNLESYVAAQAEVASAIDFSHATRAKGRNNLVRTDPGPWRKRHCAMIIT